MGYTTIGVVAIRSRQIVGRSARLLGSSGIDSERPQDRQILVVDLEGWALGAVQRSATARFQVGVLVLRLQIWLTIEEEVEGIAFVAKLLQVHVHVVGVRNGFVEGAAQSLEHLL
jgi:hypothetical protein